MDANRDYDTLEMLGEMSKKRERRSLGLLSREAQRLEASILKEDRQEGRDLIDEIDKLRR